MRVVVAAVPGSGKTSMLKVFSELKPEVRVVNYGDYMLKHAKELYGIEDRDAMRKVLPLEAYRRVQVLAAREIASIDGDLVIDTHLAIRTRYGFYPGMPSEVVRVLRPDVIFLVELDPEVVLERRRKDLLLKSAQVTEIGTVVTRREREIESPEEIELHQMMNRYFAVAAASEVQAVVRILNLRGVPQTRPFEHAEMGARALAELFP